MKNFTTFIRTIALCLAMLMMGGKVKGGDVSVNTITLSSSQNSLTYGSTSPNNIVTYTVTVTGSTGNAINVPLIISQIPSGSSAVLSPTSVYLTNKGTATATLTITYTNSSVGDYTIKVTESNTSKNATSTYRITKRALTVTGTAAISKTYDGNKNVTITGLVASGIVTSDNVTLDGIFASQNAGSNISISSATLSPAFTTNYTLTSYSSLSGTINKCPLTVTGTAAISKTYDGNKNVTITGLVASGIVASDNVTLDGTFTSQNAGSNISISSATLSPAFTTNYTLTSYSSLSGTINKCPLTVTGTAAISKTYDGNKNVTITGLVASGIVASDNVTLDGTFASQNAGSNISISSATLSPAFTTNYTLTSYSSLSGTINKRALTVSLATVIPKVFDGNATATITGGNLTNLVPGEEQIVKLNTPLTGTYSDASVGENKTVTTNYSISGSGAANYSITQSTLSGIITAPIAVTWSGTTTDWNTPDNWTPPYLPDATVDVTIANAHPVIAANTGAACKNLTIESSGGLTINAKGSLTVSGNLDNKAGASGLSLVSEVTSLNAENGTGSLLVQGTTSGSATLTRAMKSGNYHLVTSPLGGQTINDFLTTNATIQTGKDANADYRNMRDYNPTANDWNDFFKVGTSATSGNIIPGKGYSIRIKSSQAHQVVFTGTLPNGDIPVENLTGAKWNCIGNPYTSAITINTALDPNTGFLGTNIDNLNSAFGSIYVWDPSSNALEYTVISNASRPYVLQQGQAFMVCLASDKNAVSFNRAMQTHDVALELKSTDNIWPTIQMVATADSINSSTTIAFHDGMTPGLDVSYDAGLLKAGSPIDIYTRLIDDYGIPFAIQALPSDQYGKLVIPVGVDYPKGGTVTFSAKGVYLPAACRPILEDRLTGIKTDLTDQSYTADLSANTAGVGRFYLHTSWSSTGVDSRENSRQLTAWASGNNEINIKGQINNGAMASLFDLQGRLIATNVMREGVRERFSLPAVKTGVYLLQVRDNQQVQTLKITIGQ